MEQNRYRPPQVPGQRPGVPPRPGKPIGDISRPARRPITAGVAPAQPVSAHLPNQVAPSVSQPAATPQQPRAGHHKTAAPPATHATPGVDATTISLKLRVPQVRRLTVPPIMKQYPGFWWLLVIAGLLLFTMGYQIGHSHAKQVTVPLPVTLVPQVARGQVG